MAKRNATSERLDNFEERLARVEQALRRLPDAPLSSFLVRWLALRKPRARDSDELVQGDMAGKELEPGELPVEPWKHLVRRPHPWRKQLYLKGRNLTARQLVGGIRANRLDEENASANYGVPLEAIREALAYVAQSGHLLETEAEIERLMLKREGISRGPQCVS